MTQAQGVAAAIAPAVEPEATNPPAAESLNAADETLALRAEVAKLKGDFDKLRSVKDTETAAEKRAKQELAEQLRQTQEALNARDAELTTERNAHWKNFNKYAPKEDVEQALTAYQQEAAERQQQEVQRAKWQAWKWETLAAEGVPAAEIKAARNQNEVNALLQKYREERLVTAKEDEIEQRVIEKLRKEGVIAPVAPPPKTPLGVGSEPSAKKKVTKEDVLKASEAYALHPRNKEARVELERLSAELAKSQT